MIIIFSGKNLTKVVELKSGFLKRALNETFIDSKQDFDLHAENFKAPRHRYSGELKIKEDENQWTIAGT